MEPHMKMVMNGTYTSEESLFDLLYLHIDNKEIFETIGYDEGERDSENDYTGEPTP